MSALSCFPCSTKLTYRVYVGKYNLAVEEPGSYAITPEKLIVNEKWNPLLVALGYDFLQPFAYEIP